MRRRRRRLRLRDQRCGRHTRSGEARLAQTAQFPRTAGALRMITPPCEPGQWEFMQTRAVKWKWRQLGREGIVLSESAEFAFLAHCMKDAERNGFAVNDHII